MNKSVETPETKEKADGLVTDYKARLAPYVHAMKERGYFGAKMKAEQDAQAQLQNDKTADVVSKSGQQPVQKPMTGADPVHTPSTKPGDLNHGLDQPDGDFMSVSKEVKPDSSDESRAPQVDANDRPKPASSVGMS